MLLLESKLVTQNSGTLYIVSTPIGNLADISQRAIDTLSSVDVIAAEDTRRTGLLLSHYGINKKQIALHDHNEEKKVPQVLESISNGQNIALVSDAGTPLINDPGFDLVRAALDANMNVVPVPGPCSPIVALSVSGLPTDRFIYEGFLPAKQGARVKHLEALVKEARTILFLESSHRIVASLKDMLTVFGEQRTAVVARELTKTFETIKKATLANLVEWIESDTNQTKGEFVVVLDGNKAAAADKSEIDTENLLKILLDEGIGVKQTSNIAAKLTGKKKKELYTMALELSEKE